MNKCFTLLLGLTLGTLSFIQVAKADTNYLCSVAKFVPDTEDDDQSDALSAPKATIVKIQKESILVDKDSFVIIDPKKVGLKKAPLAGYNYFTNRRLYLITNSDGDVVFVSQPYNMTEKEIIPKDRITYSKCSVVDDGVLSQ